jgi:hypothetical protein
LQSSTHANLEEILPFFSPLEDIPGFFSILTVVAFPATVQGAPNFRTQHGRLEVVNEGKI